MKFLQIFNKTPNHKKFNFTTRFYDPQEEERQEREKRILQELEERPKGSLALENPDTADDETFAHRKRIVGSFRTAKKTVTVQKDPSTSLLRLVIFTILTVGLIAYLQYGKEVLYIIMLLVVPLYLYWRFKSIPKKNIQR